MVKTYWKEKRISVFYPAGTTNGRWLFSLVVTTILTCFLSSDLSGAVTRLTGTPLNGSGSGPVGVRHRLDSLFHSYSCYHLGIGAAGTRLPKQAGSSSQLRLRLGEDMDVTLSLSLHDVRSGDYVLQSITPSGITKHPRYQACTYRGVTTDDIGGAVRLTVAKRRLEGFIEHRGKRLYIEPVRNLISGVLGFDDVIVAYHADDIIRPPAKAASCGIGDSDREHDKPPAFLPDLAKRGAIAENPSCVIADLALVAHSSMVEAYGSVEEVEVRITSILSLVNELYADPRLNIIHELVELVVDETGEEDFGGVTGFDRPGFSEWAAADGHFQNEWDIAGAYFFNRGGGTVGRAKVGGVCTAGGAHIIRDYTSSLYAMFLDHAHELAHNWGANHVNNSSCLLYPTITGKNDQWCESTIATIVKYRNSRTCLAGCDQPPTADFSVKDSNSCSGTIQFTDRSRFGPRSWLWDFGDGTTSTERNPVHGYLRNGVYSVSLTVANDHGEDTYRKSNWLTIDALEPPIVSSVPEGCAGTGVTLSATGPNTIKWYDVPIDGVPLHVGEEFETPPLTEETNFYVENGPPEFALKSIGPVDTTKTDSGAYKETAGNIFMEFETYKPLRFRSFTVYANKPGPRHFVLTRSTSASGLLEHITTLDEGKSVVHCNWTIEKPGTYRIWLENTVGTGEEPDSPKEYFNNLYRARSGVDYPVELDGLMAVTTNYWRESPNGDPDSHGWYIGYNWNVQEINPCAGARIPVTINKGCNPTGTARHEHVSNVEIRIRHGRLCIHAFHAPGDKISMTVYSASGRPVYRVHEEPERTPGPRDLVWIGTDQRGESVAHGMFFCVVRIGKRHVVKSFFLGR